VVRVRRTVLEFYTPCNFSATANAKDFRFCTLKNPVGNIFLILGYDASAWSNKNDAFSFSFFVKSAALKQQISKFYQHIISTEASYQICTSQWPVINVKANVCAYDV